MYTKDKSVRLSLRLNAKQFEFVKSCSEVLGINPSEFVRSVLNSFMSEAYSKENQIEGN